MLRSIAVAAALALGVAAVAQAQHTPMDNAAPKHSAAPGHGHAAVPTAACTPASVGPQSPRELAVKAGENANATFPVATSSAGMSICNLHFHKNAEHKGVAFNVAAAPSGFQCNAAEDLSPALTAAVPELPRGACGGSVKPGDTIEVHWVFTSCTDTLPGPTLGACSSERCSKPTLRVEAQVFLLVNGGPQRPSDNIARENLGGARKGTDGKWQPTTALPPAANASVQYRGSTTNTAYDNVNSCSPLNVTWNVRTSCRMLDIRALNEWCEGSSNNPFREKDGATLRAIEGHGARKLVTLPKLLSKID